MPTILQFLDTALPHHYINQNESINLANKVWSSGVLPKLEEYHKVILTLKQSFARASHSVERTKMSLISDEASIVLDASICTSSIEDMRDVSVLPSSMWELTEMGPRVDVCIRFFGFRC